MIGKARQQEPKTDREIEIDLMLTQLEETTKGLRLLLQSEKSQRERGKADAG